MTKKKKIVLILALAAVVLAAAVGLLCWFLLPGAAPAVPTDPNEIVLCTTVAEITGSGVGMTNTFSGVVEPQKTLEVQRDSTKKIGKIYVTVGQEVAVGDPLFNYDTEELTLQLQQAQLQLESYTNQIQTMHRQLETLEQEKRYASGADQLSYTLQIQSLQLEIRTVEYDQSLKAKEVEQLERTTQNSDVLAEMAGVIREINETPSNNDFGEGGSNAFMTILATGNYRIKATATELNLHTLYEGLPVTIISRVDPQKTWSGYVESIEREARNENQNRNDSIYGYGGDSTQASKYTFYIALEQHEGLLLGQHIYVQPGDGSANRTGLWLSSGYLVQSDTETFVWMDDQNHRLVRQPVTLGDYDEQRDEYEILAGLTASDRIAVPQDNLHEGMYAWNTADGLPETEKTNNEYALYGDAKNPATPALYDDKVWIGGAAE